MKTFTKNFETSIAKLFFEDFISNTDRNYYVFAAKTTPYENGGTLPTVGKGVTSSFYDIQDQIVFGKRISDSDIRYMITRNEWVTGTVYDIYDDKDDDLFNKNFFVFTEEGDQYSLFKCLSNNFGAASTDKPLRSRTTFQDELYQTGDGYIWKLLTTISSTEYDKFKTDDYAPLEHVSDAPTYAVDGALEIILVEEEGSNYNSFAYGSVKSTAYNDDPARLTIQTDTEKDIYELTMVQSGAYPATNSNTYLWSFDIGTDAATVLSTIAAFNYANTATTEGVDLLGTAYASDDPILQVSRDPNFSLSYADFTADKFFVVTDENNLNSTAGQTRISNTILAIAGALGATPYALFTVEIDGRKLGDISGNGLVDGTDAGLYQLFWEGTLATTNPTAALYIQSVMLPFMYANASTYADYLPVYYGLVIGLQIILVPELSANNSFYVGSSFYIRGGTGAGQLKTITDYSIIGNDRIITVDSVFDTEVDSTSRYEISPRVVIAGDGTGARAIAKSTLTGGTAGASNGIREVEVIDSGTGYSYANVTISGNTGLIDTSGNSIAADSASVRAIISPPGGHGSNIINETYASAIGVSIDFEGNTHPIENDYHMFGIISNPIFREVVIAVSDTTPFEINDTITQSDTGAKGTITNIDGDFITLDYVQGVWTTTVGAIGVISTSGGDVSVTSVSKDTSVFKNIVGLDVNTTVAGQQFEVDELITQQNTSAMGYVHHHDLSTDTLWLSEVKGSFMSGQGYAITGGTSGIVADINSITESDIYPDSGEILYIETTGAITRNDNQIERVKIVTKF